MLKQAGIVAAAVARRTLCLELDSIATLDWTRPSPLSDVAVSVWLARERLSFGVEKIEIVSNEVCQEPAGVDV